MMVRVVFLLLTASPLLSVGCGGASGARAAGPGAAGEASPEQVCTHGEEVTKANGSTPEAERARFECRVVMHGFRIVDHEAYGCYASCATAAMQPKQLGACARCGLEERTVIDPAARARPADGYAAVDICDHAQRVTGGDTKLSYRMCLVLYSGLRVYDRAKFDCFAPCLLKAESSEAGAACLKSCDLPP